MGKLLAVILVTALILLPAGMTSGASALQISPLRLEFSESHKHTTLTVKNRGTSPSLVQVEVFRWAQQNGHDVLEPSRDVLVSPPVFSLGPNSEQLIRAIVRRQPDQTREVTYRILLREVASDFASDTDNEAIRVLLGFSLPVFLRPNDETQLSVRWRVVQSEHNKLKLYLHNQGTQHVQVVSVDIQNDKGKILSKQPEMAYVLPDNQREWLLDMESLDVTSTINLVAKTNNGELREALALEQP